MMVEKNPHNSFPVRPEQDTQQLHGATRNLSRVFRDVRQILTKPYDPKYESPLEIRFCTSTGRIMSIGLIEDRSGKPDRPTFTRFNDEWHEKRGQAILLGYKIKSFREYLEEKSVIS